MWITVVSSISVCCKAAVILCEMRYTMCITVSATTWRWLFDELATGRHVWSVSAGCAKLVMEPKATIDISNWTVGTISSNIIITSTTATITSSSTPITTSTIITTTIMIITQLQLQLWFFSDGTAIATLQAVLVPLPTRTQRHFWAMMLQISKLWRPQQLYCNIVWTDVRLQHSLQHSVNWCSPATDSAT